MLGRSGQLELGGLVGAVPSGVARVAESAAAGSLPPAAGGPADGVGEALTRLSIFENYVGVAIVAFLVTVIATPFVRRLAIANGIVDRPSDPRKIHKIPIAYLGGVAVYLGIMAGIVYSYLATVFDGLIEFHPIAAEHMDRELAGPHIVPWSVLLGLSVITLVGLWDDVASISPTYKIAGQLFAAAALAYEDVGVRFAEGLIMPVVRAIDLPTMVIVDHLNNPHETLGFVLNLPAALPVFGDQIVFDAVYWVGTGLIAFFVLGACNASNLIDGLDGLLSGTTAICTAGLLVIALGLALVDDGRRDAQRIVMCLAVLGACLGFLPHNFNPATIFLGDCGSLLLGYCVIVIILTLGDTGRTYLVLSGLIIYGIPITDTVLAIIRRKMAGRKMSDADSDHLHHMLKRAMGVKGAVLTLYGIGVGFAALGVAISESRQRIVYAAAMLFASYIGVYAIKIARRKQLEEHAVAAESRRGLAVPGGPAGSNGMAGGTAGGGAEAAVGGDAAATDTTRGA